MTLHINKTIDVKQINKLRIKLVNKLMGDMNHKGTTQEQKDVYNYVIELIEEEFCDEAGELEE